MKNLIVGGRRYLLSRDGREDERVRQLPDPKARSWEAKVNLSTDRLLVPSPPDCVFESTLGEDKPVDDALGHAWKISYHTVRSMVQTVRRLKRLAGQGGT